MTLKPNMPTLRELEQQIKSLITEEKWFEAYKLCNQILSYDPENSSLLKFKKRIEKEVQLLNQRSIQQELQKLEVYLNNHQYEEYLRNISPLQTYINDFPEIGQKILQAKKLLDKEYNQRKNQALQEIQDQIKNQGDNLDFETTLQKLEQINKLDANSRKVKSLQAQLRNKYINTQLHQNQQLLKSHLFQDIIVFLLKLKKVDSKNRKITTLIEKVKAQYQIEKIENKKDFIFKTLEEVKILFITKKFDLSIELCERILSIDPKNQMAQNYLLKSETKAAKASLRLINNQVILNYQSFPTTKAYLDGNYIKI